MLNSLFIYLFSVLVKFMPLGEWNVQWLSTLSKLMLSIIKPMLKGRCWLK
jgi:hypothetical protein